MRKTMLTVFLAIFAGQGTIVAADADEAVLLEQVAGDAEEGGGGSIRRAIERE